MSASLEAYRGSCDVSEIEDAELEIPSSLVGLPTPDARLDEEERGGALELLSLDVR